MIAAADVVNPDIAQVVEGGPVAIIGAALLIVLVCMVFLIRHAISISRAVNHVGEDDETLVEMVKNVRSDVASLMADQKNFDVAWGSLPEDINNGTKLAEVVHGHDRALDAITARLDQISRDNASAHAALGSQIGAISASVAKTREDLANHRIDHTKWPPSAADAE